MLAVVLVGGLGTRLRPVVGEIQKPMVEIDGKPFLEYLVSFLIGQGVDRFVFCVGYKSEMVEEHFGDGTKLGVRIDYAHEEELLGTAGALKNAEKFLDGEDVFLMLNGDSFVDFDLAEFKKFFDSKNADFAYVVAKSNEKARYGNLTVDEDGRLENIREKEVLEDEDSYISTGVYLIDRKLVDLIPAEEKYSLETDWVPTLLESDNGVYGFVVGSDLIDIGTPESLEYFKQNRKKFFN